MYWTYRAGSKRLDTQLITIITGGVEQEIPATINDLIVWFDADSSYVTLNGSDVENWTDRHNGYNITASASEQPEYIENYVNGKPAINFDGTEILTSTNATLLNVFSGSYDLTYFLVVKPTTQGTSQFVFEVTNGGGNMGFLVDSSANIRLQCPNFVNRLDSGVTIADSEYELYSVQKGTSGNNIWYIKQNGNYGATISKTQNLSAASTAFSLGAASGNTFNYTGHISEMILYNRALTNEEVESVENYLFNKYWNMSNWDSLVGWFQMNSGSNVQTV